MTKFINKTDIRPPRPSWEKDTPNPKQWERQWETTLAKIFPRHDMSKGREWRVLHSSRP